MSHCALVGGWMAQQHTYPAAPFSARWHQGKRIKHISKQFQYKGPPISKGQQKWSSLAVLFVSVNVMIPSSKIAHCALVGGWMVQQHTYPVAPFSPSSQLDGISEGEINVFRASEKGVHAKRFMILLSSLLLQLQVSVSWRQIDYSLAIY